MAAGKRSSTSPDGWAELPDDVRAELGRRRFQVVLSSFLAVPIGADQAAALADPVRLRLLSLVADAGEICSCDLQEPLGRAEIYARGRNSGPESGS